MSGSRGGSDAPGFLPDFCAIRTVFALVLIGELLAMAIALATPRVVDFWHRLAEVSLFVQWVALGSAALLCAGRRWLAGAGTVAATVLAYLLILAVTLACSIGAIWLLSPAGTLAAVAEGASMDFIARCVGIAAIVGALLLRYFYVQHQWRSNLERESEARIQALQSRIRPHFLFNSMNTIASLTRSDPPLAERVVEDLADLFRVSLGDARVPIPLTQELSICRRYLSIEALRMGRRLKVLWDVDGCPADALVPALSLQPLVENAVYHGVEPATDGGTVRIAVRAQGRRVRVEVVNSLAGADQGRRRSGHRMAQANVAERLRAFFGAAARFTVSRGNDEYRVWLEFPLRTAEG